jgi:hypothetical protein
MFGVEQEPMEYALNKFRMVPFLNRHERKDIVSYWMSKYDCSSIQEVTESEYNAVISDDEIGQSLLSMRVDRNNEKAEEKKQTYKGARPELRTDGRPEVGRYRIRERE